MSNRRKSLRERFGKKTGFQLDPRGPEVDPYGIAQIVTAPNEDKVVEKVVPVKVTGVTVGKAFIYHDGSIDTILDESIPEEIRAKINAEIGSVGYVVGTGDGNE